MSTPSVLLPFSSLDKWQLHSESTPTPSCTRELQTVASSETAGWMRETRTPSVMLSVHRLQPLHVSEAGGEFDSFSSFHGTEVVTRAAFHLELSCVVLGICLSHVSMGHT